MDTRFDLVVVGLGAMGSAALLHGVRQGLRVLGIDRHPLPHSLGSSHAESRITRLAVGEGAQYLPFAARSHEIWRQLEAETGTELLYQPGGYIVTPPTPTNDPRWGSFVHRTADIAADAGIDFEIRTPEQLQAHLPNVRLQGDESIGFEPTGGIVMCERAVQVQLKLARAAGASVVEGAPVRSIEPGARGVTVSTANETYVGDRVIVTTGAWIPELAPTSLCEAVAVTRQTVFWFEVDEPEFWSTDRFPFFLWPGHEISDYSGIFPMPAGGVPGLKVLGEQFHAETTAEGVDRTVTEAEIDDFYERLVEPRLAGVRRSVVKTAVCLYTNTVDDHFVIDTHPLSDRVLYASPCSGHGFKHSTALGEAMVQLVTTGSSTNDLSSFAQ